MKRHLASPAMIVALVALFSSLTGGAVASSLISGKQIRDHTVPLSKLTPAAVASLKGRTGPIGPAGPAGTFDASKVTRVVGDPVTVQPGEVASPSVSCPSGAVAVGGGGAAGIGRVGQIPLVPAGSTQPTGWAILVYNDTSVAVEARPAVVCASS